MEEKIFNLLTNYGLKPTSHDSEYLVNEVHQVLYDRREASKALQRLRRVARRAVVSYDHTT